MLKIGDTVSVRINRDKRFPIFSSEIGVIDFIKDDEDGVRYWIFFEDIQPSSFHLLNKWCESDDLLPRVASLAGRV